MNNLREEAVRRPDLFLVGAPKAGTTSLYRYLREHPDVYMSPVKEPMYFSPDVFRSQRNRYVYGRDEAKYLSLFEGATHERRVGEASTHYLASPKAPSLVKEFQPEARIVVMLRNPADLAYAWHDERVQKGIELIREFALALEDPDASRPYLEIARYGSQLERWVTAFGRERVHVIVFDDFVGDAARQYRAALEFLGVDAEFQPQSFAIHNARSDKSRLVQVLHSSPGRMSGSLVRRVAGEDRARAFSRQLRELRLFRLGIDRPPLPEETRARLDSAYRAETAMAGELIGRDLVGLWLGTGKGVT